MSRKPTAEAVALRQRLRDTEVRLRLLAMAVLRGDPGAVALARVLADATMVEVGEMPEAADDSPAVMPEARSTSTLME